MAFQYGYHISVLNQIQAVLTCEDKSDTPFHYGLPTCIPMSELVFSTITAVFTIGGLAGSLIANIVMDRHGRKGATCFSAILTSIGAGVMSISASASLLGLGRFLVGTGSGIALCVGPVFLSEIAPPETRGSLGVLTQLGIVIGIMITQALGLHFATPTQWRSVLLTSFALSVLQLGLSIFAVESPTWLGNHGFRDEKKGVIRKLWKIPIAGGTDSDPLIRESEAQREEVQYNAVTVPQLLVIQELRKPLLITCLAMIAQQMSGVNAVLYYSNDILSKSLPDTGPYVSLGITIVNVLMTFPPILLIEHLGRRRLLILSTTGALFSLIAVGFGLDSGLLTLSSITIVTFIMSFAIGLGPVPFVMIPEVSPPSAVSAISSVALSLNWLVNFTVGLTFMSLRKLLSGGVATKEGRVFYVFGSLLFASMYSLCRLYRD